MSLRYFTVVGLVSMASQAWSTTAGRVLAVFCTACWLSLSAIAEDSVPLSDLENCDELQDDAEQLACFRQLLNRHKGETAIATDAAGHAVADVSLLPDTGAKQIPAAAESGSNVPDTGAPTDDAQQATQSAAISTAQETTTKSDRTGDTVLNATIARVDRTLHGKIVATLDNGQVWRETDGSYYRGTVTPGAAVVISKRRFGGYRMIIADQPGAVLVRRSR